MKDTAALIEIEGRIYEAVREFPPDVSGIERAIIKYEADLLTFAYREPGERAWRVETSDSPRAPPEQEAVLAELVKQSGTLDTTTVDVEPPA